MSLRSLDSGMRGQGRWRLRVVVGEGAGAMRACVRACGCAGVRREALGWVPALTTRPRLAF